MPQFLRAVWCEPRAPGAPARVWRDWALVGVLALAAVVEGALRPDLVAMAIALALVPTVLWRRTRPLLMVAIGFTLCGLSPLFTGGELRELQTTGFLALLPYALFRWGRGREMVIGSVIMLARLGVILALHQITLGMAAVGVLVLSVAAASGTAMRYRARARQREREQAESLERERQRELEQAKSLERERLARDLHDTVAHHVSAIAIRAQAGLATMSAHPEAAADALRVIEAEATRTLAEMRAMVRVLRRSDKDCDSLPTTAPAPCIADLALLAGRERAGPVVDVEIDGDTDGLPQSVDSAIYRLAQESVTNARRHARNASRIQVRVAADERSVRLRVTDDGESGPAGGSPPGYGKGGPSGSSPGYGGGGLSGSSPGYGGGGLSGSSPGYGGGGLSGSSPGYGLIGMRERAGLLGGTCVAGPGPDRGWTVTAVLPLA